MLHIALFQPEIPPNTGNIIRLCANTGARLHLIHPLGFALDDQKMRRAGLDYHEWAEVCHYTDFEHFSSTHANKRIIAIETGGTCLHTQWSYQDEDIMLFGQETKGLPGAILKQYPVVSIPMRSGSRSLNLSNSVAVVLYEAWRQLHFAGSSGNF